MNEQLRNRLVVELLWLIGLLIISTAVEYIVIFVFDLHPALTVKIQGIIGFTIIGYGFRHVAQFIGETQQSDDTDPDNANRDSTPG